MAVCDRGPVFSTSWSMSEQGGHPRGLQVAEKGRAGFLSWSEGRAAGDEENAATPCGAKLEVNFFFKTCFIENRSSL